MANRGGSYGGGILGFGNDEILWFILIFLILFYNGFGGYGYGYGGVV